MLTIAQVVNEEIDQITSERKGHEGHYADESEFAASTLTQTRMLSVRICRNFWRDPRCVAVAHHTKLA